MLARRLQNMEGSGIRKIFNRVQDLKNTIDLSIGQPDFDVPPEVKAAAVEAIEGGFNRYTVTQGIAELRRAIVGHLKERRGVEVEDVIVTSGTAGGILLAVFALLDEGAEALIPDPYFILYKNIVAAAGAVPRFVDTYPDFKLTPERLRAAVTPATKMLFLNNPVNPTGVAYTAAELKGLAAEAKRHGLWILSDEIYDAFSYEAPHESLLRHHAETVMVNAFSKSHGMPGWRMGYAAAPREVLEAMQLVQQFSFVCAPSPFQRACVTAIGMDTAPVAAAYRRKRDLVCGALEGHFEFVRPSGAFYVYPKAPWGTGEEFVKAAIEEKVLIVPGSACSRRDTHFRISYAAPEEALERGCGILVKLARRGGGR